MKIKLRYFGQIADWAGKSEEVLYLDLPADGIKLIDLLRGKYEFMPSNFRIAVNRKLAKITIVLEDGDEVALLPPFAGG